MAADPNNAEVLLSLGVSYTNELDQGRALNFLSAWLSRQPAFTKVNPFCLSPGLYSGLEILARCDTRAMRASCG